VEQRADAAVAGQIGAQVDDPLAIAELAGIGLDADGDDRVDAARRACATSATPPRSR
jgi:hypothetical protein